MIVGDLERGAIIEHDDGSIYIVERVVNGYVTVSTIVEAQRDVLTNPHWSGWSLDNFRGVLTIIGHYDFEEGDHE